MINIGKIKAVLLLLVFGVILSFEIGQVNAQQLQIGIEITPSIIDEKGEARDMIEKTVKIKNNTERKLELYAVVNDIKKDDGVQASIDPSGLDKASSLARWVDFFRGAIEINPGEEKSLPLKISVNLSAKPGKYYSSITFVSGTNLAAAEAGNIQAAEAQMLINIEVQENVVEKAEGFEFKSRKSLSIDGQAIFDTGLKNIGNKEITPKGLILIYDRNDREVASLDLNASGQAVKAGEVASFENKWSSQGKFGKFKAKLEAEYGSKGDRNIQDTIYFWIMPKWMLAIFCVILALLIGSLGLFYSKLRRHAQIIEAAQEEKKMPVINLKNKTRFDI